jgi:methionyl-tRNA synthetase
LLACSRSTQNRILAQPIREVGLDALRYYLLRSIRPTGDGDFSHERFRQRTKALIRIS